MDIRKKFLLFFKNNDHLIMPSSSLIPENDKSVLLTTAGMQQFKSFYLGLQKPPHPRIATVQKCFRTSDIENIGKTNSHLTFFEMLGNFAFADYFKKEAIGLALKFLLDVLKLSEDRIWVTVFGGFKSLPMDKEAEDYWIANGIPKDRICRAGMRDNFWGPAGDTGPCGPSTEIYYDFGPETGCKKNNCSPRCDCGRFIEIWNLVFTQYNFNGKKYLELPGKNIDTGMGLERICAALHENNSVFNTSLFNNINDRIVYISDKNVLKNTNTENTDRALKIISDHVRAIYFLTTDGVLPSNEGRGYILRRIIRRAIRYGRVLGIKDCFLNEIGSVLIKDYKEAYPELEMKRETSFQIVKEEEEKFARTLKDGMKVLLQNISELKAKNQKELNPEKTFRLYDTYGFPVELTEEILKENGLITDIDKFREFMINHINKSKEKTKFDKSLNKEPGIYEDILSRNDNEFVGYEKSSIETVILKILAGKKTKIAEVSEISTDQTGEIIIKKTPFYSEKGGAAGDKGKITNIQNNSVFEVTDTQSPFEGLIIHKGIVKNGTFRAGDSVTAEVDINFRKNISKNHTATHILHWALRNILGSEVEQAGSYVTDKSLRFDYKVFDKNEEDIIKKAEELVNRKIIDNDVVKIFETTREYAEEIGAIALFEEKYGKFVRVVEIGNYSRELCGGIHVKRTGEIGFFKVLSESGIGTNLRRIEAVTGIQAYNQVTTTEELLKNLSKNLNTTTGELAKKISDLKKNAETFKEKYDHLLINSARKEVLASHTETKTGEYIIYDHDFSNTPVYIDDLDIKNLGILTDELKELYKNKLFCVFSNIVNKRPVIVFGCTPDLKDQGIDCSKIAREVSKIIKGGGGGKAEFAQAGGTDTSKIKDALKLTSTIVRDLFLKK